MIFEVTQTDGRCQAAGGDRYHRWPRGRSDQPNFAGRLEVVESPGLDSIGLRGCFGRGLFSTSKGYGWPVMEKGLPLRWYICPDKVGYERCFQYLVDCYAGDHCKLDADTDLADLYDKNERAERSHTAI